MLPSGEPRTQRKLVSGTDRRKDPPQDRFGIQNRRSMRVHADIAKPLKNTSVFDEDNGSVVLSDQDDAFVFVQNASFSIYL